MPRLRRTSPERPRAVPAPLALLDVLRDGPAPLRPGADPDAPALDVALVGPPPAALVDALQARGHCVAAAAPEDVPRADLALAVGTQTVPAVLRAPDVAARAVLLLDDEPDRYPASAQRLWAAWGLRQGLHAICASPWLAERLTRTLAATTTAFDRGIDHATFRPLPTHRRDDLVLAYAPPNAARRAVPLLTLALTELHRRRPDVEIALFGDDRPLDVPFAHRPLGVLEPDALAHAYASATVGVALSLTNPSVVPVEMAACGLPAVELDTAKDDDAPCERAQPDPLALCAAIERLLDDLPLRADRSRAGTAFAAQRTWPRAAEQVEAGLREALRRASG